MSTLSDQPTTTPVLGRRKVPIYAAMLLLIFHSSLVMYINSSYLEQFLPDTAVGTIYTIGSAVSVLIFLFISRVLEKLGNFKLTLWLLVLNAAAVYGLAFANTLEVAVPLFLAQLVILPLIFFNLDIFLEAQLDNNETATGSSRGLLLTLSSIVSAIAPLLSTSVVAGDNNSFALAYVLSASTLLPVLILLLVYFRDFSDPPYGKIDLFSAIRSFWRRKNIRLVFFSNFTLQFFFVFMVVYTPIYLVRDIGLSWAEFGVVIFFAQLAYVIFEYPVGVIADRYIGEQEMMGLGFMIIAISTAWIAFVTIPSVLVWSVILFVTRVGASLVEVTTESYFFKKTNSSDAQIISFFRITRPLAYVLGAMTASFTLLFLPYNLLFIVVACLMIPTMFLTTGIEDTK